MIDDVPPTSTPLITFSMSALSNARSAATSAALAAKWSRTEGSSSAGVPSSSTQPAASRSAASMPLRRMRSVRSRIAIARSAARVPCATAQPLFSAPTRFSAGTTTSSRKSSQNPATPVACRMGRASIPGVSMSMTRQEMPLCLDASGSVRTRIMHRSAWLARLVQTFWPLMT